MRMLKGYLNLKEFNLLTPPLWLYYPIIYPILNFIGTTVLVFIIP